MTLFGGFAPTIVEAFIHATGDKFAPSYYVLLAAVLSGVSLVIVAWRMSLRNARLEAALTHRAIPCRHDDGTVPALLHA